HEAWSMRDALLGEPAAPAVFVNQRIMAAHLVREWAGCRSGLTFDQALPALVEVAELVNTRLDREVASETWRRIAQSPCVKALPPDQRRWLELLEAVAQRDPQRVLAVAPPLLEASGATKTAATELALFATVTSLMCEATTEDARAVLKVGRERWMR